MVRGIDKLIRSPRSGYSRPVFNNFSDMVRGGGSALLALNRFNPSIYELERDLQGLGNPSQSRACLELLRAEDPRAVELAFSLLPSEKAVAYISNRFLAGGDLPWEALRLFARAPGLTREQIFAVLNPLNPGPINIPENEVIEAVEKALRRKDGEIRGVDGRQIYKRRIREMLAERFPELGPGGSFMILVYRHDRGPRINMLLSFRELLVKRIIGYKLVGVAELPELMRTGRESDKMIVARHPEAAPEQLRELVCEKSDWIHPSAYRNAISRGLRDAVVNPRAMEWVHEQLINDPETTEDQLHRLEGRYAEPLFEILKKLEKSHTLCPEEQDDLILLEAELHLIPTPHLGLLVRIAEEKDAELDANAIYYRLALRLYPEVRNLRTVRDLRNHLNEVLGYRIV